MNRLANHLHEQVVRAFVCGYVDECDEEETGRIVGSKGAWQGRLGNRL